MEGLLPMVFKAIKKHKDRKQMKQYQLLSAGAALSYNTNVAEFYPQNQGRGYYQDEPSTSMQKVFDEDHTENIGHRRYNSTIKFSSRFSSSHQQRTCAAGSPDSKKLVGFGSQKLFPCLAF